MRRLIMGRLVALLDMSALRRYVTLAASTIAFQKLQQHLVVGTWDRRQDCHGDRSIRGSSGIELLLEKILSLES